MGVELVIDTFVTHPTLQIKRVARGVYVDERYDDGEPAYFRVAASIRPDTGADLQNNPEGQAALETRVIYTRSELWTRTSDSPSGDGHDPDLVILGAGAVAAAAASLYLGDETTNVDTTITEQIDGIDGNVTTFRLVAGMVADAGVLDESAYPAVQFTFKADVTTVADLEAALADSDHLTVKIPGTPTNVLAETDDETNALPLSDGFGEEWRVTKAMQYRTFWKVWIERLSKP